MPRRRYPRRSTKWTVGVLGAVMVAGALVPLAGAPPQARASHGAPGHWAATNFMAEGRSGHTATLLSGPACASASPPGHCGKVLVTGGDGRQLGRAGLVALATAELYDPVSGTWSQVRPMRQARTKHAATLLADGRVLVTGGLANPFDSDSNALASAEIFDPGNDLWSPAQPMSAGRSGHSATRLGGSPCSTSPPAAHCGLVLVEDELFNAGAEGDQWTPTGPGGQNGVAVLLQDGTVLVVGAGQVSSVYDPAAVDPATGRKGAYAPTGPMVTPIRRDHSATVLDDGRVLVVESCCPETGDTSRPIGGQLYHPGTRSWRAAAPVPVSNPIRHTATLLAGGRVLVAGGCCRNEDNVLSNVEPRAASLVYDPSSDAWIPAGPLAVARMGHTATRLGDGSVVVVGGRGTDSETAFDKPSRTPLASVERFAASPASQQPSVVGLEPGGGPAGGGAKVVVTGSGLGEASAVRFGTTPAAAFVVDSPRQITAVAPPLPVGTVDVTVVTPGGVSVPITRARFASFPDAARWEPSGDLSSTRLDHTATALVDGRVLVAGGCCTDAASQPPLATAALFDPGATDSATSRTGAWAPAADLRSRRARHRGVLLADGRVLATGGVADVGGPSLTAAEVYDPQTNRWDEAAAMAAGRADHTLVVLHDATVLAAGGEVCRLGGQGRVCTTERTAERYDPVAGSWTQVGELANGRTGHSATVLDDGRVLLVGGADEAGAPLASAEILDPDAADPTTGRMGTWTAVGRLNTARRGHTATLLPGGRVLVTGGLDAVGAPLPSAEVFDPGATDVSTGASGAWATVGPLSVPRSGHTATLLDAGACHQACNKVLVTGGRSRHGDVPATAELFDPGSGSWTPFVAPRAGRHHHSATLLADGRVVVAGGVGAAGERIGAVDLLAVSPTPTRPAVTRVTPPTGPTSGGTAVVVEGRDLGDATAVRFDGVDAPAFTIHSPTRLTVITPTRRPPGPAEVTVVAGRSSPTAPGAVFTFVPVGAWKPTGALTAALPECPPGSSADCGARLLHTATVLDGPACRRAAPAPWCGRVLVTGGIDTRQEASSASQASAQLYDPAQGTWAPTAPMSVARREHTATLLDGPECHGSSPPRHCGRVLVAAGAGVQGGEATPAAELYDPATATWEPTAPLFEGRFAHTATLLDGPACRKPGPPALCGDVLVAGGVDIDERSPQVGGQAHRIPTKAAEAYDPSTGTWAPVPMMNEARSSHTATLLTSGDLLVAGGAGPIYCDNQAPPPPMPEPIPPPPYEPECFEPLATAEVFRPAGGGEWVPVGAMAAARFAHSATPLPDGRVIVAGGGVPTGEQREQAFLGSVELYDPVKATWSAAASMGEARSGHTATLLHGGRVLVAGGAVWIDLPGPASLRSSEIYDPGTGVWSFAGPLTGARGGHAAALLDGPACRGPSPLAHCGRVLVVGGTGRRDGRRVTEPLATAEVFVARPDVAAVSPPSGPTGGGTEVVIAGSGFTGATGVTFDGVPALRYGVESPTRITAVSPARPAGRVPVAVTTDAGTSFTNPLPTGAAYTYVASGPPGQVVDLAATDVSDTALTLVFSAPASDGAFPPPAGRYVVKQSTSPVAGDQAFAAAPALCGGQCRLEPRAVGDVISLRVTGLVRGTRYHFALRAVDEGGQLGPVSNEAVATTLGVAPGSCPALGAMAAGRVIYPSGYSLVGLPEGTVLGADGPLYSWADLGAGGRYASHPADEPLRRGLGYWAYFTCPRLVEVAGTGSPAATLPLDGYHASMVGNPSATAGAVVTGHDFAARWDPALNAGSGGYHLSGYRQAQSLRVGEGTWAFAYDDTTITIKESG